MKRNNILLFVILLVNGITNVTSANLFLTVPQLCIVFFYIITGKIERAVILHFIFYITSYTYFGDFYGYTYNIQLISYSYAKLKFIGPISYSYIIALLLLVNTVTNKEKINKDELFYKFYKLLILFMVTGFGMGLIGMAFGKYYIEGIIGYGSYIIILFIHAVILLKMSNTSIREELYNIIIPLLAISPLVNFIIHQIYPYMMDTSVISLFSILLLPALLFQKKRIWINLIGLFFLAYNILQFKTSGKEIIFILIITLITFFLSFIKKIKNDHPVRARVIRIMILLFIVTIPTIVFVIINSYGGDTLVVAKINQVISLFNFALFKGNVDTIAPSPYVRITSLINIIYEGVRNPITLLFGKGYGGYFQDHFNYFANLDLSRGGFQDKALLYGDYYTGHDTLVTVPMFNGLIGLFFLLKFVWQCIKFSKNNFIILSAILFLFLVFYYNTLIGIFGVLLLFVGSSKIGLEK